MRRAADEDLWKWRDAGVLTGFMEGAEGGLDAGLVFLVGDAEPAGLCGQHADADLLGGDERAEGGGEVAFGFEIGAFFAEEGNKLVFEKWKKGGGEGPAVHRDDCVGGKDGGGAIWPRDAGTATGIVLEGGLLLDAGEPAGGVNLADAAGDGTMLRERVAEAEADHGEFGSARVGDVEELGEAAERVGAVEIVGVDDGEGAIHDTTGAPDGVASAPGFFATRRRGEPGGQVVGLLEGVADFEARVGGVARSDAGAERFLEVAADYEDDLGKAGLAGVTDGIVEDGLAVRAERVHLLEAAVAAAQAGGEDDESGGHRGNAEL